jgi:hypothetical protein
VKFKARLMKGSKIQVPLHVKRELELKDKDFVSIDIAKSIDDESDEVVRGI